METKWYTGTGDDGFTGVLGRERVPKYALRPEAYGTVDEASAVLGLARAQARDGRVRGLLLTIQRDLYNLMADRDPARNGHAAALAEGRAAGLAGWRRTRLALKWRCRGRSLCRATAWAARP